jgi:Ras-related protein Rab-1A
MDSTVKVVLVGDSGVGKSCLLQRYCEGVYSDSHISTIGVDYRSRRVKLGKDVFTAQIYDTAGQERFRAISASYYRKAQGVILVVDITSPKSVSSADRWMQELRKNCSTGICAVLLANKADQPWAVPINVLEDIAARYSLPLLQVSAKTGENVGQAIDALVARIVAAHNVLPHTDVALQRNQKKDSSCCV